MMRTMLNVMVLSCTLLVESALSPVLAEATPPALDRQQLLNEIAEMEAEVERIRRTRGEGALHRQGLRRKLADKRAMAEFHLKLIDRLERTEQRLNALETRGTGR